jgi:carboxyl-terminal processing protease
MRSLFLFLLGYSVTFAVFAQEKRDFRAEAVALHKLLLTDHIQPQKIDDKFSAQLFDRFFRRLDSKGIYFTSEEIASLGRYATLLDDEINGQQWTFVDNVTALYRKGLERAKIIVEKQSETPFPFALKNTALTDSGAWLPGEKDLSARWRSNLHYITLEKLVAKWPGSSISFPEFYTQQEYAARTRAKGILLRKVNKVLLYENGLSAYVGQVYLDCMVAMYDPHSVYFNVTTVEVITALLSSEGLNFGIAIKKNERGNVVVSSLEPGGPAWKSGVIQVNDEIIALQSVKEPDAIDLEDLSFEEIDGMITDDNHTRMKFTVRKESGEVTTVELAKAVRSQNQNLVRSYVLVSKNGRRYGYIVLPDFYTAGDIEDSNSARCANDVAKEILKLAKEEIEGLILDVRYNGGGALKEAIALSGIFIDGGAICMQRKAGLEPKILKDVNRGTVYDGPLIVMVNGRSASASELLTAALQDHRRAVVVGSRTFGKATGQNYRATDEDMDVNKLLVNGRFGFARVTTSRVYRVTGKTWQCKGIVPDIVLPDYFDLSGRKESSSINALIPDSLVKQSYYQPLPPLPVEALRQKSTQRVAQSVPFNALRKATTSGATFEQTTSFNALQFLEKQKEQQKVTRELQQAINEHVNSFNARMVAGDEDRLKLDQYARAFHQASIVEIERDVHLDEACLIMNDLVELIKK